MVSRADKVAKLTCRLSENLESLKFLEPSKSMLACAGIALPLPLHLLNELVI